MARITPLMMNPVMTPEAGGGGVCMVMPLPRSVLIGWSHLTLVKQSRKMFISILMLW